MGIAAPRPMSRAALGPKKADLGKMRDATKQIGEVEVNAVWWTTAGAGLCAPRAWALIRGADGVRSGGAEMWNPDDVALYRGTTARTSTGIYTYTLPTSAPDETGDVQPIIIRCGKPTPQSATTGLTASVVVSANVVTIKVVDKTDTLVDADVLVEVR